MKRLFYLVDQMDSVEAISEDLHQEGITDCGSISSAGTKQAFSPVNCTVPAFLTALTWPVTRNAAR